MTSTEYWHAHARRHGHCCAASEYDGRLHDLGVQTCHQCPACAVYLLLKDYELGGKVFSETCPCPRAEQVFSDAAIRVIALDADLTSS